MKKMTFRIAVLLLILCLLPQVALAAELIPVGRVIGLELKDGSVTVAGFEKDSPAKAAGLREGDRIWKIDGVQVSSAGDVREALAHSKGSAALTVQRGREELLIRVAPTITAEGNKLGVFLREGITGIGTVTFYDPQTGDFATLGHGVNTPQGKLVAMTDGSAYSAKITSVRKGKAGDPGQLMGSITAVSPIARLDKNTAQGVFGSTQAKWTGKALPTADKQEIREGRATILSNISGESVREYSVEIAKIYANSKETGRNMLIRITDPALLEATGGIVQGMSGSPIIQDGKLIGAVTHVLVNDPTTGYGIFIENMLDAAA